MGRKDEINGIKLSSLMLLSLFIDEWNIFSVPMISIFMERSLNFGTDYLGIITGATVGGAAFGSILGGVLTDRAGRRKVFLFNVILFAVSSVMSALSPNVLYLSIFRFLAGIPAGSDIANVYSYIMESVEPGKREVTGSYNTLMATLAILGINTAVILLAISGSTSYYIWKIILLLPVFPSIALLSYYRHIPESTAWKRRKHTYTDFFRKLRGSTVTWHTSLYSWLSGIASGIEVGTFAFFIPYIILRFGVPGLLYERLVIIGIYMIGVPAGYLGPRLLPMLGMRRVGYTGFSMSLSGLILSGISLIMHFFILLPAAMMIFVWGNHWNNQPIITSQALTAGTEFRGKATGFSNFLYMLPSFLTITVFPLMFSRIGIGYSTLVIALASLFGIVITLKLFHEVYGYTGDMLPEI
ncbi:MAG: MFS transporter [Ferroplasma sp.]|uniref:MFS transporter n=1 Tax=Ferroplasma sp. TaxID=2591003 RepID=UPI00281628E1|nr:MFS transporter [Ferroplasma sp.]WMT51084.1 MAG: MFS transporter [Ferroplasma sp.]